jgi:hypothetical protein
MRVQKLFESCLNPLIFRHHMTRYLGDPYVMYLHVETFEDRNPEIVFLIKFACASPA